MFTTDKVSILAMPHATLALWLAAFEIGSIAIFWYVAPEAWGVARTLAAGVLMGAMSFYMLFINRILVS